MAEDAVDAAVKTGKLRPCLPCRTVHMPLVGASGYTPALFTEVAQNYVVPHRPGAIDTNVAKHLAGKLEMGGGSWSDGRSGIVQCALYSLESLMTVS